jgi:hypothetical protein
MPHGSAGMPSWEKYLKIDSSNLPWGKHEPDAEDLQVNL